MTNRTAAAAPVHRRHARAGADPREQTDTTAGYLYTGPSVTISLPPGTAQLERRRRRLWGRYTESGGDQHWRGV